MIDLASSVDDREIILIDVVTQRENNKVALEALHECVRSRRVTLIAIIDWDHQKIHNSTSFCGTKVPTCKDATIDLRLRGLDGEEDIFLCENYEWVR